MDILGLVSSVSRVAIAAFVITLIVVGYEVFVIMKRKKVRTATEEKDIKLPDFKDNAKTGDFTPVDIGEEALKPAELQSRRLSKKFLPVLLVLLVLIVLTTGYLIYRRNQVSSVKVDVNDVSPVSDTGISPTQAPRVPLQDDAENAQSDGQGQGGLNLTPTIVIQPTSSQLPTPSQSTPIPTSTEVIITEGSEPTPSISTEKRETVEPTPTVSTISPTPTSGSVTSTPIPTLLPQAGTYQTTLIITIVAISVIYLALIL